MKLNPVGSNQTEVETERYLVLFSYKTPVAARDRLTGSLYRTSHKWSNTTSKHINKWLDGAEAEEKDQSFFDGLV